MPKLAGKVAVITGGTSGIGLATAELFSSEGAAVVVTGHNADRLEQARARLGEAVVCLMSDVRSVPALRATFGEIGERFGGIDVLFANAGISRPSLFDQVTEDDYDEQMAVNARGVFFTVQAASSHLREGASVILNSSINAHIGMNKLTVYSATKAAIRSFTRTLGFELAPRGIRVNSISPGSVATSVRETSGLPDEAFEGIRPAIPMGRVSTPEEIARIVLFLACSDSSYMLGADVIADGGITMV
jgi:NAD(P)-dependent dehydrogenase (short-subunit alcohol dehydrogenase family)